MSGLHSSLKARFPRRTKKKRVRENSAPASVLKAEVGEREMQRGDCDIFLENGATSTNVIAHVQGTIQWGRDGAVACARFSSGLGLQIAARWATFHVA